MEPRVLHVVTAPVLGGAQQLVCALAEDQIAHGLQVAAATSPGGPLAGLLRELGAQVLETPLDRGLRPRSLAALRRFAGPRRPQVLHAHGARATLYAVLASRGLRGVAVLSHVHLADPWRFDGGLRARLDRIVSGQADRIIACSEGLRQDLIERQGFPADRTVCIPNGIDLSRFEPALRRAPDGAIVVGTCVRLEPQKGVTHLIEAAALLAPRLPELRLAIAGDGSLREALQRQAADAGIAGRVEWLGHRRDVPQVLAGFDLFVLPSLAEGLPLAVIEAMAAGVPVIATAAPGTVELVRPGETGLLVPPASAPALADAILEAVQQPQAARLRSERALALVRQRHDAAAMCAAVRQVYAELAGPVGKPLSARL
jgi:glycosyltransferase involved in cell wall biosynthesis